VYIAGVSGATEDPSCVRDDVDAEADEHVLLGRLRSGDERAFDHLVRTWSPLMRRVARSFVSTEASAQEVVQEAWLGVIQGLAAFEARSSLRTWIFRILVNVAKTRGIRESRTIPMSSLAGKDETGPTVDPNRFWGPGHEQAGTWTPADMPRRWDIDPEISVLRREVRDLVSAAVEALPGRQREVVVLRDVHGFDSKEVCALLGLTAENQRVLLHRGRAKIRVALEAYYSGEDR
jgi:RNA polymerase sigma-70 factor (ECF subfamily)